MLKNDANSSTCNLNLNQVIQLDTAFAWGYIYYNTAVEEVPVL
jgi:hypothetical protein